MSRSPDLLPEQQDLSHDDYVRALELFAEVSDIVIEDMAQLSDEKVIGQAETLTYLTAPERAVDEAEDITYDKGVRLPKTIIGEAKRLTYISAPERAVDEAEAIAHKNRIPTAEEIIADAEKILKLSARKHESAGADRADKPESRTSES